jgi:hypothetical protein
VQCGRLEAGTTKAGIKERTSTSKITTITGPHDAALDARSLGYECVRRGYGNSSVTYDKGFPNQERKEGSQVTDCHDVKCHEQCESTETCRLTLPNSLGRKEIHPPSRPDCGRNKISPVSNLCTLAIDRVGGCNMSDEESGVNDEEREAESNSL